MNLAVDSHIQGMLLVVQARASKGKAPAGPSSSGFGKWGQKLKQAFKGKGRGWGGRQQLQQGRGWPEVEESQQSTARQPIVPPGGVQQQQQPQQFQQPQAGVAQGWSGNRIGPAAVLSELAARGSHLLVGIQIGGRLHNELSGSSFQRVLRSSWTIVERAASLNYARKRRGVVQFAWELAEGSA
ncbi:hypothetical protein Taro_046819 [Colocasia esculenta]|uniref:Uncharacterized protein n=1 Tax=Colocasia esculenta TaxID=4460 RepID=A0A843WTH2_COLES|nr:hypothetical protein [Colocasia esculenta]